MKITVKSAFEFTATVLTIISYCLISENILIAGFFLGVVSEAFWIIWANMQPRVWGIIIVNACLLLASVNGLWGAIS
jgi:hypothetical protein